MYRLSSSLLQVRANRELHSVRYESKDSKSEIKNRVDGENKGEGHWTDHRCLRGHRQGRKR
jgi:hypothetical protein